MTTKFIAVFKSAQPNLYKVTVVKETEKTLIIEKPVKLMGWIFVPTRIKKSSYNIFDTHLEALAWLVSRANHRIISLKTEIENARQMASYLSGLRYEIESGKTVEPGDLD